ncbi:MAG: hypothetical protein H0T50_11665 [Gemmatimonadales bacterium]|nr:hypothetical protein [Gemmatimonadales bacterium]
MQLLVSVRAVGEVGPALGGGADIIDAKEPAHGSLGAVSPEAMRAISGRVPAAVPFSVALGDFTSPVAVRRALARVRLPGRGAPIYLKLGFAGQRSDFVLASILAAALETAAPLGADHIVVPVAYADHGSGHSPLPEDLLHLAITAGARAFLVDTCLKDGRSLLDWLSLDRLSSLSAGARSAGLLFAAAGSLDLTSLGHLRDIADVVGVRGAACRGGREGWVDSLLVRRIRERLDAEAAAPIGRTRGPSPG